MRFERVGYLCLHSPYRIEMLAFGWDPRIMRRRLRLGKVAIQCRVSEEHSKGRLTGRMLGHVHVGHDETGGPDQGDLRTDVRIWNWRSDGAVVAPGQRA